MTASNRFKVILAVLCMLCAGVKANAGFVNVINHSFEAQTLAPGTFATAQAPTGWSAYGNIDFNARAIGALNPNSTTLYTQSVPDGSNVGVVFLMDDFFNQGLFTNSEGGMQQTLAATLESNSKYTLTVEVGNISNDVNFPHSQFQFSGFPGYRVDLLAGNTVIASESHLTSPIPSEGGFRTSTLSFTSGTSHSLIGQSLGIRLVNLNASTGIEVNFDNVRLEYAAVPEPSSLICATIGAGLLIARRRFRRK